MQTKKIVLKKNFIFTLIILLIILTAFSCQKSTEDTELNNLLNQKNSYSRIISLSPSTTEILFALGLGKKVVGVTDFCNFPEHAKQKPKVGGYLNPNYEAILLLKADIVIILPEQENVKKFLAELDLKYFTVNNKTIADILSSIETIGNLCGAEQPARELLADIQSRMQSINQKASQLARPRVLISIGRTIGAGVLSDVYAAGKNTYYDELINYAGGKNALAKSKMSYPMLSAEGIIHLNPEIIIDIVVDFEKQGVSEIEIKNDWDCVQDVSAVNNERIYVLGESYTVIPGPRFVLLLEEMARIIHPEIWYLLKYYK